MDEPSFSYNLLNALKYYRNAIFKQYTSYYENFTLEKMAKLKPVTRSEMLKIAPNEEAFDTDGRNS